MKAYDIILKGAGITLIGLIFSKLISYITTIIIARIGSTEYGLLTLGLTVISFIAMVSLLGLHGGVLRYVPYYIGKGDLPRIKGTILSSLRLSLIIGFIAMILVLLFAKNISISIFNKPELVNVIIILAFMIPFIIIIEIFSAVFLSFKKIEYKVSIRDIGEKIVRLLLVILFISLGFGLIGAVYAYLLTAVLVFILLLYFATKKEFQIFNKKIKPRFNAKELLIYSIPLIITSLLTLLEKWAGTFIIGFYRSASEVGIYNIVFSTAALLAIIPTALMSLFIPVITSLYGQNKIKYVKKISNSITKWIFMASIPLTAILIIFSRDILKIIFGKEYTIGYIALMILAVSYLILSITHIYGSNLLMVKKSKLLSYIVFISTLTNIGLNIILVPKFGINGAASAALISTSIFLILVAISSWFILKLQPLKLILLKSILAGVLSAIIIFFIYKVVTINIFTLIVLSLLMSLIYIAFLIILKSFSKEDLGIINRFKENLTNVLKRK